MVAGKASTSCLHGALYWNLVLIFLQSVQAAEELSVNITVEPHYGCVCPRKSYTCRAYPVSDMIWTVINSTDQVSYDIFNLMKINNISRNGLQYTFSEKRIDNAAVITSELLIIAPHKNNTNATCIAFKDDNRNFDTVVACVTGPASPPTSLSVVWDPPSAVVSFQSPVYGGECVDYYVVTAVSEEDSFKCVASEKHVHTCFIQNDRSLNDFNFTVYSMTFGVNGVLQNGESVTDCCLSFPGNVNAVEKECNIVEVSWEGNPGAQGNVTISVNGSERASYVPTHYERGSSEDSHLLTLDYSETGPVEIAVTFSSAVCNKTTVTHYLVNRKRCLTASETTLTPNPDGCELTCPVVEDGSPTSYTEFGLGVAGGVVVGLISGIVGTVTVLLVIMRKRGSKGTSNRDTELSATNLVCESRPPAVVYETVSDVVTPTGPDTSENVAYGVSHSLPTTTQHNPAYGHITPNK